jgi:hypothetical protein
LGAGFALFVVLALCALWRARVKEAIGRSIGLALAALAVTVALGLILAAVLGWGAPLPMVKVVSVHAAWGLIGWTVLLVVVVAQQVVPMFQVTPLYPAALSKVFAPVLLCILVAWSAATWLEWRAAAALLGIAVAMLALAFSAFTLGLQLRSRRPEADATTVAWRAGMVCLALAAVVGSVGSFAPGVATYYAVLVGVLSMIGFALSVMHGMLYKIVPFLIWLHLQNTVGGRVPHIRRILPEMQARWHVRLQLGSLLLLCLASVWPRWFLHLGAATLAASSVMLGAMLLRACRWTRWRGTDR